MTIPSPPQIKLYPHSAKDLLPLLESHTPRSLPVLATILENISRPSSSGNQPESDYDLTWTTFPTSHLQAYETSDGAGNGLREGEGVWAVVARMQEEDSIHLRFYCSAESTPLVSEAEAKGDYIGDTGQGEDEKQKFVKEVTKAIVSIWGKGVTLGAISSRWNETMRVEVDARELVECSVFLAPELDLIVGPGAKGEDDDVRRLEGMGLKLDIAREEDVEMVKSTCDVPRPFAYYASRCSQSTVIRLIDAPYTAVCWIILHSDGALGALYTLPAYRRKGLAAMVVQQNMVSRSAIETKTRDFCYVFKGNHASEGLWRKMGWVEGWGVRWIVNREVEEARGKVARFSHPSE